LQHACRGEGSVVSTAIAREPGFLRCSAITLPWVCPGTTGTLRALTNRFLKDRLARRSWLGLRGAVVQYVVTNESILEFDGQESPRTWRSMHHAISRLAGAGYALTPTACPCRIATFTVTFMLAGTPHASRNVPPRIGPLNSASVRSGAAAVPGARSRLLPAMADS
jgi:hypothetical protein